MGSKRNRSSFDLLKIKPKTPENPGKNILQRCLTSQNGAQDLHKNT